MQLVRTIPLPHGPKVRLAVLAVGAIVLTLTSVGALLVLLGVNPWLAYALMVKGAVGSVYNTSETFVQATPLLFTGLGVALSFTARLWNIGAEGQLYAGAIASAAIGLGVWHLPAALVMPIAVAAGALGGVLWALIPAVLKVLFRAQEVLTTIMLNYIAIYLSSMVISGPWADPIAPKTRDVIGAAYLPTFLPGTRLTLAVPLAFACAGLLWVLMYRTTWGYRVRAVGLNADAARLAGIRVRAIIVSAFCVSGGLAGLAGASLVLGTQHALVDRLSPGYGYTAIAVALLGGLHPLGTAAAALVFAGLYVGSQYMQIAIGIPATLVQVLQGILLLTALATRLVGTPGD